ncbi:cadherin-23 isoform X2 [Centruroides vittatus]|uniref:cadherin-23 isoform X2 n=1 Tax=Centruroides vittatus TaxID=120091 RepID=UPI00350E963C
MYRQYVMHIASVLLFCIYSITARANSPPKFQGNIGETIIKVNEGNDSVGKLIYKLRGEDADGDSLRFGVAESKDSDIVRIENVGHTDANVYLNKELDREKQNEYKISFTLTDGKLSPGQFIHSQELHIIVEDVNDNEPIFRPFRPTVSIPENAKKGLIIEKVKAEDSDAGPFGQVIYRLQKTDEDTMNTFSVRTQNGEGVITLIGPLDYEKKSIHQLRVLAIDRANTGRINTATAAILIKVEDVEDQPPEFIIVPPVTRIPEDLTVNSHVLTVKAVDGDRGVNNAITYRIIRGGRDLFAINSNTGRITVQKPLDRESTDNRNGAFILEIEAQEVAPTFFPPPSVTTEVTIILNDVNDETPTFKSQRYIAEINENAQDNVPVNFIGESIPEVFDHDQGNNGTFRLFLEGDNDVFEVTPEEGVNEASFLIRVKNSQALDYEITKLTNFKIIARESVLQQPKSSSAEVTIYIRDVNDNFPEFSEELYKARIPENVQAGTSIITIKATDRDSKEYGTSGIRYTEIRGQIADKLHLDTITGEITVTTSQHGFDRELTSQYYVTIEARDDNGHGNRNTVQLQLSLEDVNDNVPYFLQTKYEARLVENEMEFLTPLVVKAQDDDLKGSPNSEIRYEIIQGDKEGNFTIDNITGEIRPRQPIDYERIPQGKGDIRTFSLTVRAYDLGFPSLYNDVPVIIYIQDQNDHTPTFQRSFYSKSIQEDTPNGTSVLQVIAFDGDHSQSNSRIAYRIQSGAQDKFVINANTGVISVAQGANLDPDRTIPKTTFYLLEVLALDGGIGDEQRYSKVLVNISITDVNNKPPIFMDLSPATVREDAPIGHFVTIVSATDLDERPILRYSIDLERSEARNEKGALVTVAEFDYGEAFDINSVDGIVKVTKALDREKVEIVRLLLKVEDLAASTEGQTSTATLTIKIDDVNDNRPEFQKQTYRAAVTENAKPGSPILTVVAEDADLNRTLLYYLEGNPELTRLVRLDRKSGEITANNKIDREVFAWLNLTVLATDNGVPPLTGTAQLFIQVLDENDNNPIFNEGPNEFYIPENAEVGQEVAIIQATDADIGDYGRITYLLDPATTKGQFRINRETGLLTVAESLDREEVSSYTLIVQAWDNYEYGFSTGESRKAFKQVTVYVTDINDNRPEFIKQRMCATVTEFHDIRETIFMVSANDKDDPNTSNGQVSFSIESGNQDALFDIENMENNMARVVSRKSLRNKFGNYTLKLRAQDGGNYPLFSLELFNVCVSDVNDNSPVFLKPPKNFTIKVAENATLGTVVVETHATDADVGQNGEIRYRLKKLSNGDWRAFNIDEKLGTITLREQLDRERQKSYELRVEAYDLGKPTSLSTDLDIIIFVTNVNDYSPEFLEDVFQVMFTENMSAGQESFKLISTVDKDDDDSPSPKPIPCYFIVDGNKEGRFKLDIFTHSLYTTDVLDREERSNYTLIVQATDDCLHVPNYSGGFDPRDNTLLQVNIGVRDINDNPPRFVKSVFTGGVTTDMDFGTVFMSVKAVDLDIGENSIVNYYIVGEIQRTLSEGLDSIKNSPFAIDRETGQISLTFDPQKGMKGYFDFEVLANDTDGLFSTARVFIYLLREDQRVRFVLRLTPEELREKLENFRDVLSNITGAIVNVDEYKYHENHDGSVDKKKSDLYMHFVNREDNSIMDVNTVLSLLDRNIEFLDELFKEFNVLESEAAKDTIVMASVEGQVRAWLIGLAVFLAIMLVLVISLCLTQRSRYERKLKAATATAFGSQDSALNRMDVPNTNQHSVEGSNPIWMHAYDNEWYKDEEELSHRSEDDNSLDENAVEDTETSTSPSSETTPQHAPTVNYKSVRIASEPFTITSNNSPKVTSGIQQIHNTPPKDPVQEQNDLNKSNKHFIYGSGPVLLTPHIANLETSEL